MEYCVISPFSRALRNGKVNPKNYPFWDKVVEYIHDKGLSVKQIGSNGESRINGVGTNTDDEFLVDLNFEDLEKLVKGAKTWASIDNFFHHFCHSIKIPGVVIFGRSDPKIFGHPENVNILKDRKYLRPDQFGIWESLDFDPNVFVDPRVVCDKLKLYGVG